MAEEGPQAVVAFGDLIKNMESGLPLPRAYFISSSGVSNV